MHNGLHKCKQRAMAIAGMDKKENDIEDMNSEEKARRVKTPDGSRRFGQPIGSVIKPDLIPGKKPNMSGGTSAKPNSSSGSIDTSKYGNLSKLASKIPGMKKDNLDGPESISAKLGRNKTDDGDIFFVYSVDEDSDTGGMGYIQTRYDDTDKDFSYGKNFGKDKVILESNIKDKLKEAQNWFSNEYGKKSLEDSIEFLNDSEEKRMYSDEARMEMAKEGMALPDGSYPIKDKADLENAIQAYGRAKDKEKAKKHIMKRAKELGLEDMIPENWMDGEKSVEETITMELAEFESLQEEIKSLRVALD